MFRLKVVVHIHHLSATLNTHAHIIEYRQISNEREREREMSMRAKVELTNQAVASIRAPKSDVSVKQIRFS